MIRFTTWLQEGYLIEKALDDNELNGKASKGPYPGVDRLTIFVNKVWGKPEYDDEHQDVEGDLIKIKDIAVKDFVVEKGKKGKPDVHSGIPTKKKGEYKDVKYSSSIKADYQRFLNDWKKWHDKGVGSKFRKALYFNGKEDLTLSTLSKNAEYGGGGGGVSESTQEVMTAALVLQNDIYSGEGGIFSLDLETATKMIEVAQKKVGAVKGAGAQNFTKQFTDNWYDLATALSSASAILEITGQAKAVYWTGKGWHEDIEVFNASEEVKDYNSSDIVVHGHDGVFYGFSLKKKKKSKDQDPTLINKPITGKKSLLKQILPDKQVKEIETAKIDFFNDLIKNYYDPKDFRWKGRKLTAWPKTLFGVEKPTKLNKKIIDDLTEKSRGSLIRKMENKWVNTQLASKKNTFWKKADDILTKKNTAQLFITNFMNLLFRVKLVDIFKAAKKKGKFEFYLLTGIGRQVGKGGIDVEEADTKELHSTIGVLQKVFDDGKLTLSHRGTQPWESSPKTPAAAKVKYQIKQGEIPLVNMEVRYKGSKTAEPQFQATVTVDFKALFKT